MAFRDNSALITTAGTVNVNVDLASDMNKDDVYSGNGGAQAFVIANGDVGDETFLNFGSDDSIITGKKIFDGNDDGYIAFGPNGVLDVDRTGGGASRAGADQIQVVGTNGLDINEIRYLGTKGGQFVYADSETRRNLIDTFTSATVKEGTVGTDTITAGEGATVILHDNALGLNLGGDTITGFGNDDLLVTTERLYDKTGNGIVTFGNNFVLDVSGQNGPLPSDPNVGPGGQLDFNAPNATSVHYLGTNDIDGVTYYYYGTAGTTASPFDA